MIQISFLSEKPSASNCISNMSRFKAQFQSARSLDSDIVLATASAIAASNSKDSVGANSTTEEMQEIPQQLPESAKLGSMVRQRGKIKSFISHLDIKNFDI